MVVIMPRKSRYQKSLIDVGQLHNYNRKKSTRCDREEARHEGIAASIIARTGGAAKRRKVFYGFVIPSRRFGYIKSESSMNVGLEASSSDGEISFGQETFAQLWDFIDGAPPKGNLSFNLIL